MSNQRRTMNLDRAAASASVIDVLDHVLDKGIVIDAWVRVSLAGIDLITVEARVVVASIGTYLNYAGVISEMGPVSRSVGDRRPATLEQQLQRMADRMHGRHVEPQLRRRAEDRWRDELRDAHARTILKKH